MSALKKHAKLPYRPPHPLSEQVLPSDLPDAISQAAEATADAIKRGNVRCQVLCGC